jgi:hypothetical protein
MKFALAAMCLLTGLSFCHAQDEGPKQQVPPLIAKVPERSDFMGEWLRQDGTYKLKIEIKKDGGVKVGYFNPKVINVESSEFIEQNGMIRLHITLRDEGYPGSKYELVFDASYRILAGNYAMPGTGQQHQVYFSKVKTP